MGGKSVTVLEYSRKFKMLNLASYDPPPRDAKGHLAWRAKELMVVGAAGNLLLGIAHCSQLANLVYRAFFSLYRSWEK